MVFVMLGTLVRCFLDTRSEKECMHDESWVTRATIPEVSVSEMSMFNTYTSTNNLH
jgi:hypothetical protein